MRTPPIWCAASSVSQTASAVGSASEVLSTRSDASKSVLNDQVRAASENARRICGGAWAPAAKSAAGIDWPR